MLHLVPKERFENYCKGKKPTHRIDLTLGEDIEWPYYEIPESGSWLIYMKELGIGLIFGEVIPDFNIDYSDWLLEKIGDKPNKKYILNVMKSCVFLDSDFYQTVESGEWKITNTRFSYNITFSIKVCGYIYYPSTSIGYEEKLKVPIDKLEIRAKDKLIEHICYGIRGNNKKSSE